MTSNFQIEEAARARVHGQEFAGELRRFAEDLHRTGISEKLGVSAIVSYIAAAMAGLSQPPTDPDEAGNFSLFVNDHVTEINGIAAMALSHMVKKDQGNKFTQ